MPSRCHWYRCDAHQHWGVLGVISLRSCTLTKSNCRVSALSLGPNLSKHTLGTVRESLRRPPARYIRPSCGYMKASGIFPDIPTSQNVPPRSTCGCQGAKHCPARGEQSPLRPSSSDAGITNVPIPSPNVSWSREANPGTLSLISIA